MAGRSERKVPKVGRPHKKTPRRRRKYLIYEVVTAPKRTHDRRTPGGFDDARKATGLRGGCCSPALPQPVSRSQPPQTQRVSSQRLFRLLAPRRELLSSAQA
mmetsp:Transcript_773/g.3066  ORF Transcript_773/g.3066 Transcript_773/m.3066 type:complete len:102 (+) Transcript_773:259-564(+)